MIQKNKKVLVLNKIRGSVRRLRVCVRNDGWGGEKAMALTGLKFAFVNSKKAMALRDLIYFLG